MSDAERIRSGESISLYNDILLDSPSSAIRRVRSMSQDAADRFAADIGDDRLDTLLKTITGQAAAEDIAKKPDDDLTDQDWADLRAADY